MWQYRGKFINLENNIQFNIEYFFQFIFYLIRHKNLIIFKYILDI